MEHLILVDLLKCVTQVFIVSCLLNSLLVCFNSKTVAELAGALQIVKLFLCAIELSLYIAETLEIFVAVCNLQYLGTYNTEQLLVDDTLNILLEHLNSLWCKTLALVFNIAKVLAQGVLDSAVQHVEEVVASATIPVG